MTLSPEALERRRAYNREYVRARRAADPEGERAKARGYDRKRYRENPERRVQSRESARRRYKRLGQTTEYKAEVAERKARYYQRHADRLRAERRARSQTAEAKAIAAAYAREWRKKNPGLRRGRTQETRDYTLILHDDPCSYCGAESAEVDHIDPVSNGGSREWENCTAVCSFCNRSKKDRRLFAWMAKQAA